MFHPKHSILFAIATLVWAAGVSAVHAAAVATVEGRDISSAIFDMYVANASDAVGLDSQADEQGRARLESSILAELIDRSLIVAEAQRRGLAPAPEKLEAQQARWRKSPGGMEEYQAYLEKHGLSDAEFRASLAQELYGELLREELTEGLHISDAAVADFYRRHRDDLEWLRIPARVSASHILVAARHSAILRDLKQQGLKGAALQEAVANEIGRHENFALSLRERARTGEDFAALAREYSDDPGSRADGGDLGWFTRATHTLAFDDAVFALAPGEIGPVVKTDYGFHVVRVSALEPGRSMPLEDAEPEIRRRLMAEQQAEVLSEWLRKARAAADITIRADIPYSPPKRVPSP